STPFNVDLTESTCILCGNCVNVCPVGALREKQAESMGRIWEFAKVNTVCPYCGCGCVLELNIKDNRIVKVLSPLESPANSGNLCIKGKFCYEFVHSPERLTKPLIRQGPRDGEGDFREASWDEALNLIADKIGGIKAQYGSDSIGGFSSAKCSNEENYLFQKFVRMAIGTNNVDHCARLCHASSVTGLAQAIGSGAMTNSIKDIPDSEVILVIGSNTTEAHPIVSLKMKEAVMHRGAKLIVIDPRPIPLTEFSHSWLRQKPGTDVAIINGMIHHIIGAGLEYKEFISKRTEGFNEFKESIKEWTPKKSGEVSGVPEEIIKEAAELYSKAKSASIFWAMGITQHTTGTDNVLALANLALLTGNFGKPGAGLNPLRGQNNVQGACDMGALPNLLPGYLGVNDPEVKKRFESSWGNPLPAQKGLTIVEMVNGAYKGDIKALYIMGENPLVSDPDINHVREAFLKLEFLVVQDIFLSETARLADVVIPSTSSFEKDGTFTNTERRIQRFYKALVPPGEAKDDWEIICAISARLGYKMHYRHPSEIMEEISGLTPIYGGVRYERLDIKGLQWPCPDVTHPGTEILHKAQFTRGMGKFHPVQYLAPREVADKDYPFVLTTGRLLQQYHTGTMTRRVEGIRKLVPECLIEINKEDAEKLYVTDKEMVRLVSRRGAINARLNINSGIKPGVLFMPFHFAEAAANTLTIAALDPVAKIPEYKVCAVRIEKIN
ncbi:MAG: formate dehydrogenase subunit alpha, partial [Candidatus Omnitrophica bacterium]|nr:formate dehydrogenase subunit alpha [Candidatus Omnitrophota bacterium]